MDRIWPADVRGSPLATLSRMISEQAPKPLYAEDPRNRNKHTPGGGRISSPVKDAMISSIPSDRRANATFVTLVRNSDLWEMAKSIRQVEDRFNRKFGYDWVFLNDVPFSAEFIRIASNLVSGTVRFGVIPHEHWSFPPWIDAAKAKKAREDMVSMQSI